MLEAFAYILEIIQLHLKPRARNTSPQPVNEKRNMCFIELDIPQFHNYLNGYLDKEG